MGQPSRPRFQLGTPVRPLSVATLRLAVCLLATASLSGCSGSRFGDQLARSFSAPEPAASPPATNSTATGTPIASGAATSVKPDTAKRADVPAAVRPPAAIADTQKPAPSGPPAPYRVTLRLPAADSSAPAERVTQALRAAGVTFEVETIERISASGDGSGSAGDSGNGVGAPRRMPAPPAR
jgi:hypothetical protein